MAKTVEELFGRKCSECKRLRKWEDFYNDYKNREGFTFTCDICNRNAHGREYIRATRERNRVYSAVRRAVISGKLPPIKTCACKSCGKPATNYHHHNGYEKENWLDVVPLCGKCHSEEHKKH